MGALLVVLPGLAIAGWLACLFIRKRHYEKGVIVFLSITLAPLLAWYLTLWLRDDSPIYGLFEMIPGGLWDLLPGLAMVGVFVALCVHWARRGQQVEEIVDAPKPATPPTLPLGAIPETDAPVKARLETLEQLRRDGLVSDDEYATKRAQILATL